MPKKGCFTELTSWSFDYGTQTRTQQLQGYVTIEVPTTEFTANDPTIPNGATITPAVNTITDWSKNTKIYSNQW